MRELLQGLCVKNGYNFSASPQGYNGVLRNLRAMHISHPTRSDRAFVSHSCPFIARFHSAGRRLFASVFHTFLGFQQTSTCYGKNGLASQEPELAERVRPACFGFHRACPALFQAWKRKEAQLRSGRFPPVAIIGSRPAIAELLNQVSRRLSLALKSRRPGANGILCYESCSEH